MPHNPTDHLRYCLDFDYDATATCPKWHKFLDDVLPDKDTQRTLQEFLGYTFTKHLKLEKVLFLHGSGSNGKGVLMETLMKLYGKENLSHHTLETLTDSNGYTAPDLENKILNIGTDISKNLKNHDKFKVLTSGEPFGCRPIRQKPITITDYAKLMFSSQHRPIAEVTDGFFRRIIFIPFKRKFKGDEIIVNLHKQLIDEIQGIMNWVLDGRDAVVKNEKIFISEECKEFWEEYTVETDSVSLFCETLNVEKTKGEGILVKDIYNVYKQFTADEEIHPLKRINFVKRMKDHLDFEVYEDSSRYKYIRCTYDVNKILDLKPEIKNGLPSKPYVQNQEFFS